MRTHTIIIVIAAAMAASLTGMPSARAHCDTLDGPVVKAGQQALESENVDYALVWIKADVEAELREAFKQALAVRTLNEAARELADRYFLETLVRLHRAGEGEPYTGIKPKGTDLGPAIPAADSAIRTGSPAGVTKLVTDATKHGLHERLQRVKATRKYKPNDIVAGRAYVAAYVAFLHYVERVYADATAGNTTHEHH